jgi:hypothetical protein
MDGAIHNSSFSRPPPTKTWYQDKEWTEPKSAPTSLRPQLLLVLQHLLSRESIRQLLLHLTSTLLSGRGVMSRCWFHQDQRILFSTTETTLLIHIRTQLRHHKLGIRARSTGTQQRHLQAQSETLFIGLNPQEISMPTDSELLTRLICSLFMIHFTISTWTTKMLTILTTNLTMLTTLYVSNNIINWLLKLFLCLATFRT